MAWAQVKKKKKKKPYADYDLRPRPMAWAQVITGSFVHMLIFWNDQYAIVDS